MNLQSSFFREHGGEEILFGAATRPLSLPHAGKLLGGLPRMSKAAPETGRNRSPRQGSHLARQQALGMNLQSSFFGEHGGEEMLFGAATSQLSLSHAGTLLVGMPHMVKSRPLNGAPGFVSHYCAHHLAVEKPSRYDEECTSIGDAMCIIVPT